MKNTNTNINLVHERVSEWKRTEIGIEQIGKIIDYFSSMNETISNRWLSNDLSGVYQQTYDNNKQIIDSVLRIKAGERVEGLLAENIVSRAKVRIEGLYENWVACPDDETIPPLLEAYIYLHSIFTRNNTQNEYERSNNFG